jgi:hypothetical protein
MSSGSGDWQTPACVLERVRKVGPIALDPCTTRGNPTRAFSICLERGPRPGDDDRVHIDGLAVAWVDALAAGKLDGLVYVNCPYGRAISQWTKRCNAGAAEDGLEIIALLPARTDTRWWRDCTPPVHAQAVCFWAGRLRFVGAPASAPFPSALVYWGPRKHRFADAFADVGAIWI